MTRASKTKKIVDGQMGEFKNKNLFFILSGVVLALDPTQFQ